MRRQWQILVLMFPQAGIAYHDLTHGGERARGRGGAADACRAASLGRRILWVDDRPEWNIDAAVLFRMAGMTVDVATSTREANRRLQRDTYALIITDMHRHGVRVPT
jgi:hypothetical protein